MLEAKGKLKDEDRAPNLEGLEFYITAFQELSSTRPNSMGVSPIPFTAIREYFKVYPCGDFEEFHYLVRRMDNSFLKNYKTSKGK